MYSKMDVGASGCVLGWRGGLENVGVAWWCVLGWSVGLVVVFWCAGWGIFVCSGVECGACWCVLAWKVWIGGVFFGEEWGLCVCSGVEVGAWGEFWGGRWCLGVCSGVEGGLGLVLFYAVKCGVWVCLLVWSLGLGVVFWCGGWGLVVCCGMESGGWWCVLV